MDNLKKFLGETDKANTSLREVEELLPGDSAPENKKQAIDYYNGTKLEALNNFLSQSLGSLRDFLASRGYPKETTPQPSPEPSQKQPQEQPQAEEDEYVEYTYQPGDTFGAVIKKLGLNTSKGLWGSDGDVNFYTQQLIDQGLWPEFGGTRSGNIPIGTRIRLRRRK